jgi:NADH-quinone oxidoreductase subunit K
MVVASTWVDGELTQGYMLTLQNLLILGMALIAIGTYGVVARRNILIILLSIELMLNGVNLMFIGFSSLWLNLKGQIVVLFTITVAAAEAAVGLVILSLLLQSKGSTNTEDITQLRH